MRKKGRKVRGLILRNYMMSVIATFSVFTMLLVLFGFDLEDQIFDQQLNVAINKLMEERDATSLTSGDIVGVQMQYYVGLNEMPEWLQREIDPTWGVGNYELFAKEKGHIHMAIRETTSDKWLYVLFNARPYIRSTPQIKSYLVIILGMGGLAVLISLYFTYRMTKKLSKPLEKIAAQLSTGKADIPFSDTEEWHVRELEQLVQAMHMRDERIQALLKRERQFNRDASHELRTPLTVATGATEILEGQNSGKPAFLRLQTSLRDMKLLTEGILWLSRDADDSKSCGTEDICKHAVRTYEHLLEGKEVDVRFDVKEQVLFPVPEPVAHVIIGNIIRNAFSYTDGGTVAVRIVENKIQIEDTGVGFGSADKDREGFGIGLSLVQRLCDHFSISLAIETSGDNKGTIATLTWL